MAQSSRKQSTSSTDPESLILQGKDVKEKKQTKKSKKTSSKSKKTKSTKSKPTKSTKRQHVSRKPRRPHATLTILSTLLLALASAAGIAFAVLATAVLHLQVAGDVPSRIAVFGSSAVSVGLVVVQTVALCSSPKTLLSVCLLLTRLVLLAWIAAVVLTSLEVANTVKNATVSGTLAAQAVYLNLLLSSVGLIATGILSFCLERATRKGKQNGEDDDDTDDLLDRSVSQRGSVISEKDSVDEEAADVVAEQEPRPKKLLFSYKATTQLMDDTPASRRASMLAAPVAQPEVTEAPTLRPSTSIKRKPVQSVTQPKQKQSASAADRRKSVMQSVPSVQMFSDPFADPLPVDNPFSDSNRIDAKSATRASRRLSRMPTQALPKLNTAVAPVAATSTFYLDSSGSSNYDNEEEQEAEAKESDKDVPVTAPRASLLPYSPAVTRPLSIVPPMPQVSVPKVPVPVQVVAPVVAVAPPQMAVPRRKPVGSAAGPIKRKPVPSMIAAKAVPKMETQPAEPLSPMSQPAVPPMPAMPTLLLPVSIPLSTQPTIPVLASPSPTAQLFGSAVSSRKSSNASDMSDMESSPPSLADMVASSLRRVSVAPSSAREMDLPSAVSKAFGAAPLPTRSVAYAQPRVLDQPIVRKSFIATSGGGGGDNNSRRPSEVSIMETIYSPAEGDSGNDSESEGSEDNKGEDDELAAMVRQEAEAAAAAADAGRRWLEPSRDSVRDSISREPQRVERTLSVSKHLSKKPSLSPVEEKEQESTDESEEEEEEEEEESVESAESFESVDSDADDENPAVHTIVVHEPAGFTATGLSRTASRMRKAALAAAKMQAEATAPSTTTSTSVYIPAYTRRRLSSTNNYNFSRPMRSDSVSGNTNTNTTRNSIAANRMSIMSTMSSGTGTAAAAKRASLVPPVPQTSLLVSPRSRVRRQLLQMLPMQHRPATLVAVAKSARTKIVAKPVRPKASPRKGRQSLSGRRRRRSLSIDLTSVRASDSDADLSSASSASSSRSSRSPRSSTSRSSSLAKTAQRARRRNHARGHLGGLRSSTLRPTSSKRLSALSGGSSPYTPYTPHNRPISPMTLLMERAK